MTMTVNGNGRIDSPKDKEPHQPLKRQSYWRELSSKIGMCASILRMKKIEPVVNQLDECSIAICF